MAMAWVASCLTSSARTLVLPTLALASLYN
jgi:hypothetical protein